MTYSNGKIDLAALMYALAQQQQSLPEELQTELKAVGPALQESDPNAAQQMRQLISHHPSLEAAYLKALEDWDANYASQERSKSLSQTFPTTNLGLLFIQDILPSDDWVGSVKRMTKQKRIGNTASFWDNSDRIGIMGAGGGFLGGMIVQFFGGGATQLIGAAVGMLAGGAYGWWSTVKQHRQNKNS
jgi:hypothetical protein